MYPSKTKVLLLSSDYGEGHQQVAEAIKQAIHTQHPRVYPQIVNVIARLHPRLHPVGRSLFLQTVKRAPTVYGYLYRKTYQSNVSSQMLSRLSQMGLKRLQKLLDEEEPSVVVSTHPFAAGAISALRERGVTRVPTVTVITDHTVHQAWIHPHTDFYIVGSQPVKEGLNQNGVQPERILVTGIPLREAFEQSYEKEILCKLYQLNPKVPIVLIMGGGLGIFGEGMLDLEEFDHFPQVLQIIIVCGHNENLRTFLEETMRSSRHKILIKGYVNQIHELMALSDIIITKPGGVTTSEAMALEVPMLLYKPIPGQEEDNLQFLIRAGVARVVEPNQKMIDAVSDLLQEPETLAKMKECAKREGRKRAAKDAAAAILIMMEKGRKQNLHAKTIKVMSTS
jgi:processive 1,2-diacylglycerol beta-glucosyltransferase